MLVIIYRALIYLVAFIAALYNAAMDKLKDHFSSSIWWNKTTFWPTQKDANGKKFLGMVWDAWHLAKTAWLYLMFFDMWLVSYLKVELHLWEVPLLFFIGHGGGFNLGYNWLFKKKN
jgi:hypothetical protein